MHFVFYMHLCILAKDGIQATPVHINHLDPTLWENRVQIEEPRSYPLFIIDQTTNAVQVGRIKHHKPAQPGRAPLQFSIFKTHLCLSLISLSLINISDLF